MATRKVGKSGRAAKRPARGAKGTRKPAAKPRRKSAPKAVRKLPSPAPRRALKARRQPETLRLRSLAPSLTVRDIERSVDVYTRALGFVVVERWMEGGALLGVMLEAGACRIGLSQDDWAKGRERKLGEGVRFWCETRQDLETLASRVRDFGGAAVGPKTEPWGELTVSVEDPDGYQFTFSKAKS